MNVIPADETAAGTVLETGRRIGELDALLEAVNDTYHTPACMDPIENRLVQARLGIAAALFQALRSKHSPTAAHSLRVAIGCSAWSQRMQLGAELRDEIEVAALLHDVGKIGVPDHVLMKPGKLTADERLAMDRYRGLGLEVLRTAAASPNLLEIVRLVGAWHDGSRDGFDRKGQDIPLGARMISIFDAFDSMTTDHVYRRAISKDRAVAELFAFAGTQFDPELTKAFAEFITCEAAEIHTAAVRRWLVELSPETSNQCWRAQVSNAENSIGVTALALDSGESPYHERLLESMIDAVAFIDHTGRILRWNSAAEELTGLEAETVVQRIWAPEMIQLREERGATVDCESCPVVRAIGTGEPAAKRYQILKRSGGTAQIDLVVTPVFGRDGATSGATLILRDASSQVSLEERVQHLHEKATRDPLTGSANRAEFDRFHRVFTTEHLEQGKPGSLIICDIDFFKKVNDNYGHQAGDEALVSFAALLRKHCRTGDLVARYGGEEFVMLCADCDNTAATKRAEMIRKELAETPQAVLAGKPLTASFGVTEVQNGDTPEIMLNRADRALLQAKDNGRNQVIQIGAGINTQEHGKATMLGGMFSWFTAGATPELIDKRLITAVPLNLSVEKLRGFIADHHAEIVSIESRRVVLKLEAGETPLARRAGDRLVPFVIELDFEETLQQSEGRNTAQIMRTVVHVVIRPRRGRDRRVREATERASRLLNSLKSYLVATEIKDS